MAKTNTPKPRPVSPETKPAPVGAKTTGETCTVACKLPHGLLIRGFKKATRQVPMAGGGTREETYFRPDGSQVEIMGTAKLLGAESRTRVSGGYALTANVDRELMERWIETNKDMPAVRNGLVMIFGKASEAAQEALSNADTRSGLEPLNPKNDPRRPKSQSKGVGSVTIADEQPQQFEDEMA